MPFGEYLHEARALDFQPAIYCVNWRHGAPPPQDGAQVVTQHHAEPIGGPIFSQVRVTGYEVSRHFAVRRVRSRGRLWTIDHRQSGNTLGACYMQPTRLEASAVALCAEDHLGRWLDDGAWDVFANPSAEQIAAQRAFNAAVESVAHGKPPEIGS